MVNSSEITRTIIAATNEQADILAKEQAKNKLLSQWIENGKKFNFNVSRSSQRDVYLSIWKNQLLCESNKFTIMRREYKKMIFLESLSVQTIQPHCCKDVPACNWSILSRENFSGRYLWCQNTLATHPALEPIKRKKTRSDVRALLDLEWPPLLWCNCSMYIYLSW